MTFTIRQRLVICVSASTTFYMYLNEINKQISSNHQDIVEITVYLIGIFVSLFSFYLITRDV